MDDDSIPDQELLKREWEAELKYQELSFEAGQEPLKRRQENHKILIEKLGLDVESQFKQEKIFSEKFIKETEAKLLKPPFDIEALHKEDLKSAKAHEKQMGKSVIMGNIWSAAGGGGWTTWTSGDPADTSYYLINAGARKIDAKAHATGDGYGFDLDFSRVNAWLTFYVTPPVWGLLTIKATIYLHGSYSLYSNDTSYTFGMAVTTVDTWIRMATAGGGPTSYDKKRHLTIAGQELHPTYCGRVDAKKTQTLSYEVEAGEQVHILVGVLLYCSAQAAGSQALLDFYSGSANHVYIPNITWYLSPYNP